MLSCSRSGKKDTCALTCPSRARFLPGIGRVGLWGEGRGDWLFHSSSVPGDHSDHWGLRGGSEL